MAEAASSGIESIHGSSKENKILNWLMTLPELCAFLKLVWPYLYTNDLFKAKSIRIAACVVNILLSWTRDLSEFLRFQIAAQFILLAIDSIQLMILEASENTDSNQLMTQGEDHSIRIDSWINSESYPNLINNIVQNQNEFQWSPLPTSAKTQLLKYFACNCWGFRNYSRRWRSCLALVVTGTLHVKHISNNRHPFPFLLWLCCLMLKTYVGAHWFNTARKMAEINNG